VRLLLDEMLSPVIARELRARGHDVQAVAEHPEREALSDPDVLALARAERRAVVTNNIRDFRPLHVEAVLPGGTGHYGMIFMPGTYKCTKNDIGQIVAALEEKLGQYPGEEDLASAEEWLLTVTTLRSKKGLLA
jgi:PHP family Zn ribbon phosphoesterase